MSITLTLKEYSEYTKQVSSFWMTGIAELYDQLGNAALTLAQKEQAFAQFCYDRMQMGREWLASKRWRRRSHKPNRSPSPQAK